jgi:hypothetical protein
VARYAMKRRNEQARDAFPAQFETAARSLCRKSPAICPFTFR